MKYSLIAFICILFSIQSCVNSSMNEDRERPKKLPRSLTSSEKQLITSGNDFSYDIFRHVVSDDSNKNVFISPLSISMALGMALNGTAGETKAGIKKTLGMSEMELQAINHSYQSLIKLLINLDPEVKMNIGNSLWGQKGFSINQSFKDTLQTYFNARVDELDFSDPASADVINGWVKDQTNGCIKKIIDGKIPNDVVLYLINAIYFKGDWRFRFDKDKTAPADFHLSDGSTVDVNMMQQKSPIPTFRSDEVQMAQLAYGDSLYNMTILMPADHQESIDNFVHKSLTASHLANWTRQLHTREITFEMPKFDVRYKKNLNGILASMGMGAAFSDRKANFSNINPNVQLVISKVMHKANITVDEEGSEAAAATSVGFVITSAPAPFRIDRPFVYLIRERISGTILFMGVMQNPAQ